MGSSNETMLYLDLLNVNMDVSAGCKWEVVMRRCSTRKMNEAKHSAAWCKWEVVIRRYSTSYPEMVGHSCDKCAVAVLPLK